MAHFLKFLFSGQSGNNGRPRVAERFKSELEGQCEGWDRKVCLARSAFTKGYDNARTYTEIHSRSFLLPYRRLKASQNMRMFNLVTFWGSLGASTNALPLSPQSIPEFFRELFSMNTGSVGNETNNTNLHPLIPRGFDFQQDREMNEMKAQVACGRACYEDARVKSSPTQAKATCSIFCSRLVQFQTRTTFKPREYGLPSRLLSARREASPYSSLQLQNFAHHFDQTMTMCMIPETIDRRFKLPEIRKYEGLSKRGTRNALCLAIVYGLMGDGMSVVTPFPKCAGKEYLKKFMSQEACAFHNYLRPTFKYLVGDLREGTFSAPEWAKNMGESKDYGSSRARTSARPTHERTEQPGYDFSRMKTVPI